MTQCCHLLHESANELVASHSFVVGFFACFVVLVFCVVFWFLFVCLLLRFLVVDDDGLLDLYRSFTSSLLRPSKQTASRLLSSPSSLFVLWLSLPASLPVCVLVCGLLPFVLASCCSCWFVFV